MQYASIDVADDYRRFLFCLRKLFDGIFFFSYLKKKKKHGKVHRNTITLIFKTIRNNYLRSRFRFHIMGTSTYLRVNDFIFEKQHLTVYFFFNRKFERSNVKYKLQKNVDNFEIYEFYLFIFYIAHSIMH